MSIKFKGQELPSFVNGVVRPPVLPPVSQTLVTVPGTAGSLDFGNTIGNRTIIFDYWIMYTTKEDLQTKVRQFAEWLYSDDAQPLELDRDPGKTYYAKITSDTTLSEATRVGKGSINFLCADPYIYGSEQSQSLTIPNTVVANNGSADTCPVLEFTFTQDTTVFSIETDSDRMVLGTPSQVEVTPEPEQVQVIADQMNTTNGWTGGIGVDGGDGTGIAGTMISQNGQFKASDIGSGTKWHGPALTKGVGAELQDFTVQMFVSLNASNINQISRIEAYLYDINSICLGKIALTDSSANLNDPVFNARAGSLAGGNLFANSSTAVKRGTYSSFYGRLTIQRIGNKWWAEIAKRDVVNNSYNTRWSKSFVDTNNIYMGKIASIQVHIGGYSTYSLAANCGIESLYVYKENVIDPSTQIPIIFVTGDKLIVDSNKGIVTKNDDPCFELLDGFSIFPVLIPGLNNITIDPLVASGTIKFRERWL